MKKSISMIFALSIVLSLVMGGVSASAASSYNANAAVAYADKKWNDGKGLCAEFVSDCLAAGGITIPSKSTYYSYYTESYKNNSGYLQNWTNPYTCSAPLLLYLSERYTVITNPKYSDIAVGDIVFMYGGSNMQWRDGHVGIVLRISNGAPIYAAHNKAANSGSFSSSYPPTYVVKMGGTSGQVTVPAAPSGVKAVRYASTSATVSWNVVSGATSYEVQYQTPNSGGWKKDPDYKTKTATSYISTGLINNYTYQYRVRAVNLTGASGWVEIRYNKP